MRNPEVRCKPVNYVPNFGSSTQTSERISELRAKIPTLPPSSLQKSANTMNKLNEFMNTFLPKIGEESSKKIKEVLVANNFTSRLSLKLLSPDNLDILFADVKLPLGSRKVLEYHLNLLNDESPLHLKVWAKNINHAEKEKVRANQNLIYYCDLLDIYVMVKSNIGIAISAFLCSPVYYLYFFCKWSMCATDIYIFIQPILVLLINFTG